MQPKFWKKIAAAYGSTVAHAFGLHGQGVNDYAEGESDLIPWLETRLTEAGFDLVMRYDLAGGITFAAPSMKKLLAELLGLDQSAAPTAALPPGLQKFAQAQPAGGDEVNLPRDPSQALPLLSRALNLTGQGRKIALILPYAADLFPPSVMGASALPDRAALEFSLNWARNPVWRGSDSAPLLFFIAPSLMALSPALAEALYPVTVEAPNRDDRLAFIQEALAGNPEVTLADGMTVERFAAMTAGLLKLHIMDIIVQARLSGQPVNAGQIKVRKDEIMAAAYAGVLETEEATGDLSDVAGLDYLVGYLVSDVVDPMKAGETDAVPMGVLMAGPPGTGKSYLAKKLAAAAGVNFVNFRMANILGGIVGQSEANLEKALQGIRSLTPCIVFVDEVDQAFRRSEGFDGSSVNRNVFGRLLNFMADTANRGLVVWLAATNRPDLLDAAMMRSGRFDAIVAVLPPDTDEARAAMYATMARKNGVALAANIDLESAAEASRDYTGADIERIILKAKSIARKAERQDVTAADLERALKAMRISTKDRDRMTMAALAVVNDLDLLPPRYRTLAEEQAEAEEKAAQEAQPEQPPTRKGRQQRSLEL